MSAAAQSPTETDAKPTPPELAKLQTRVTELAKKVGYAELYGFDFSGNEAWTAAHDRILTKFLVANNYSVKDASGQLERTLAWRKEFKPLAAAKEPYKPAFGKIGLITKSPSGKVVTWNLYGAIKDRKGMFHNLDAFLRWRVGLMERGIRLFDWESGDNSTMDQVHDYMDVSFWTLDGDTRKASATVIKVFQEYYPEFLSAKYFVNVPKFMTWMFAFARSFMTQDSSDKFHVIGNGKELAYSLGEWIPSQYGGDGPSLEQLSAEATGEHVPKTNSEDEAGAKKADTTVETPDAGAEPHEPHNGKEAGAPVKAGTSHTDAEPTAAS